MLRVSKIIDYGTLVLTHMASDPERVFSAADLAASSRADSANNGNAEAGTVKRGRPRLIFPHREVMGLIRAQTFPARSLRA